MALVPLADVIAAELAATEARLQVTGRRYQGRSLLELPMPRLRQLGRDLDLTDRMPAVLDDVTPVLIRCLLDLTAVYEYLDGERGVARFERLNVDDCDVRFVVQEPPAEPRRRFASGVASPPGADAAARGRAAAAASRASRKPPTGMVGMTEAANLSGAPVGTIRNALDRGELPVAHSSPEGYRFMRPADVLAWAKTRRRPGERKAPAAAATGA